MERLSVAPMMKFSDAHFRKLLRIIHPTTILYTEMIVDKTVIHISDQKLDTFLGPKDEHTVVQLASNNPMDFVLAAKRIFEKGFTEINLNTGCPSDRVQCGCFGAVLMKQPNLVAEIIRAGKQAFPQHSFTVKCRIGVDNTDSYDFFKSYVDTVSSSNPGMHFIVHARKAWLKGLSTKENRTVPPLHYDYVYRISTERPDLKFTINGGITSLEAIIDHSSKFNGDIMIGRAIYEDPLLLFEIAKAFSSGNEYNMTSEEYRTYLIRVYGEYANSILVKDPQCPQRKLAHPLVQLYRGHPFANVFRTQIHKYFMSSQKNDCENLRFNEKLELVLSYINRMKRTTIMDIPTRSNTLFESIEVYQ